MKSAQFIRSASAVAIISLFAGCSTWDNMSKTNQGTTVGAASGAVGGAVVAGPVGAVVGGVGGGVAGHEMAKDSSSTTSRPSMSSSTGSTSTGTATATGSTSTGIASMSAGTGSTSTARNTTNSGNNEIGTIATSPTYGGGTPKSAITAGEVAAQNSVAMNAQSSPRATAQSAPSMSPQSSPSMHKVSDVRSAQQALKDGGYNVGPIDGKMGPKTAAALRKFQKDHGIQATGRLDSPTLAALGSSSGST